MSLFTLIDFERTFLILNESIIDGFQGDPFFDLSQAQFLRLMAAGAILFFHIALIQYVFGSCLFLLLRGFSNKEKLSSKSLELEFRMRSSLFPFFLSACLVGGAAFSLFQFFYREWFISANALILHRAMAVIPAVILGGFLIFVNGASVFIKRLPWIGNLVSLGCLICLLIAAYFWSENHLQHIDSDIWKELYSTQGEFQYFDALIMRVLIWLNFGIIVWRIWLIGLSPGHVKDLSINLLFIIGILGVFGLFAHSLNQLYADGFDIDDSKIRTAILIILVGCMVCLGAWLAFLYDNNWASRTLILTGFLLVLLPWIYLREFTRLQSLRKDPFFKYDISNLNLDLSTGELIRWGVSAVLVSTAFGVLFWSKKRVERSLSLYLRRANPDARDDEGNENKS